MRRGAQILVEDRASIQEEDDMRSLPSLSGSNHAGYRSPRALMESGGSIGDGNARYLHATVF